jgi:hypothetical protein
MSETSTREIYASSNGDRWLLVGDRVSRDLLVRHIPVASSGGQTSDVDLGSFMSVNSGSPQHQRLLQMLWELVENEKSE